VNSNPTKEKIREARERNGLLQSREIIAIRGRRSRAEFAEITGLALSTIIRWENDLLVQSRSNDRYLRLLREAATRELPSGNPPQLEVEPAAPDKGEAVLAALQQDASISDLALRYDVPASRIEEWKRSFLEAGSVALAAPARAAASPLQDDRAELRARIVTLTMQRDLLSAGLRSALATIEPGPLANALGSILSVIAPAETTSDAATDRPVPGAVAPVDRKRS